MLATWSVGQFFDSSQWATGRGCVGFNGASTSRFSMRVVPEVVSFSALRRECHGLWRSLVAHLTGGQVVAGSNPVSPTEKSLVSEMLTRLFLYLGELWSIAHRG